MAEKRKLRVAFFGYEDFRWTGGINYLKNLLYAITLQKTLEIEPFLFVSRIADQKALNLFKNYIKIVTIPSDNPIELGIKGFDMLFGSRHYINYILKKYKIDVISHSYVEDLKINLKKIGWIPDFQHLHLPEMFTLEENNTRNSSFNKKIEWCSLMVLSSQDACKDFIRFSPENISKVRVLYFVSNIDDDIYQINEHIFKQTCEKYKLPSKFFYLPNQFWKHKNHKVVFEAVNILKLKGYDITIVCTGPMNTLQVAKHVEELKGFIAGNTITENIILLGIIDYKEVQTFMRYSVSVINPSLFEGWSSTVEECKSLGKNMLISDIPVHREQNPPETFFFNPHNPAELAEIMKQNWEKYPGAPNENLEKTAKDTLPRRIQQFGEQYAQILCEIIK